MKILIAARNRATVGGAESYQVNVSRLLGEAGHSMAWLYENDNDSQSWPFVSRQWQSNSDGVRKEIEGWRPDLVYLQGMRSARLERWLVDAFSVVMFAHQYHGTCPAGTKRHFFPANQPCRRNIGPACLALYLPRRCGGLSPATMLTLYREQTAHRAILNDLKGIVVGSGHMLDEYRRLRLSGPSVEHIPLAAPQPETPDSKRVPREQLHIGFVGRLTRIKGCHALLHALRIASTRISKPITLSVIGEGPERKSLEDLATRLGVEATFTGWLTGKEKQRQIADLDLLAVPSLWAEPFGLVGLEAGGYGVPAVAFDVGGISDWLRPGETGELAPGDPPRPADLADAIERAVSDPRHYMNLSKGARTLARSFSIRQHVQQLEVMFEKTVGNRA